MRVSIIATVLLISSCSRGFLPVGIKKASPQNFEPLTKEYITKKLLSNEVDTATIFIGFSNNINYVTTAHPRGQNLRIFNSNGENLSGNLCHADIPEALTQLYKGSYPNKAISDERNFFKDDLSFLTDKPKIDSLKLDYIVVYYWWDYDYSVHGRFNWVKNELGKLQKVHINNREKSNKQILLLAINCDNRPVFNSSGEEFIMQTFLHE